MLCSGNDVNPMIGEVIHLNGIVTNYHASLELFDLHSRNYFEDREQLNEFCAAETVRFLNDPCVLRQPKIPCAQAPVSDTAIHLPSSTPAGGKVRHLPPRSARPRRIGRRLSAR